MSPQDLFESFHDHHLFITKEQAIALIEEDRRLQKFNRSDDDSHIRHFNIEENRPKVNKFSVHFSG